jgi:hypothetical protein
MGTTKRISSRLVGLATTLVVAAVSVSAAVLAFSSAPASAQIFHPSISSFEGQDTPAGPFGEETTALAVDDSSSASAGDVYVTDRQAHAADKFSPAPSSEFLCEITGASGLTSPLSECDREPSNEGVAGESFPLPSSVAVDGATGEVYIADEEAGVVDEFDPEGKFIGSIAGLGEPTDIAVDDVTGDLYISFSGGSEVKKFDRATSTLSTFVASPENSLSAVAVDNSTGSSAGDVYVVENRSSIAKFSPSGELLSQLPGPAGQPFGSLWDLAVDFQSGDLYAADAAAGVVDQFDEVGASLGQLKVSQTPTGSGEPRGVAIASSGDVYVLLNNVPAAKRHQVATFGPGVVIPDAATGSPSELRPTSAKLEGVVKPDGFALTDCHFDYGTTTAYGQTAACEPASGAIPASGQTGVTATITGLQSGVNYHFRVEASNANCESCTSFGADATFETLPRPAIDSATVSNLTASFATLNAKINPRGSEARYRIEYGASTAYGKVTEGSIPAGEGDVLVSAREPLEEENKTYHWRLVATNANGTTTGSDHTFIYATTGEGLPDNRTYEMVTPPHKNGALIGATIGVPDIAANGSRVIAGSIQCFAGAESCNGVSLDQIGSPYEFTRASSGWVTRAMAPPATTFSRATPWYSSADDATALFSAPTEPSGQDDFYASTPEASAIASIGPLSPPDMGQQGPVGVQGEKAVSADLSHVVWRVGGSDPHWPFDKTLGDDSLYEYAPPYGSHPFLVGVVGENDPENNDSSSLISACSTVLGPVNGDPNPPGTMSSDGRVVYFTALRCTAEQNGTEIPVNQLYARIDGEREDAHTVAISQRSSPDCTGPCLGSPPADQQFVDASADGSKALFASTQQLTDQASEDSHSGDSAASPAGCTETTGLGGCNLYELENVRAQRPAERRLLTISAGDQSGGGPRVQGVLAFSEDGSHVYFIARGVLSAFPNAQGQLARDGANNLYVFERDDSHPAGHVVFIADLPSSDVEEWNDGVGKPANVTPDGRYLVFVSQGQLTPDDTTVAGGRQVFRYDAQTGDLLRISIGSEGFNDNGNRSAPSPCDPTLVGAVNDCPENASIAYTGNRSRRRDLTMSNDGSYVFFQSPVALTAHALDDVQISHYNSGLPMFAQNVYEWHEGHVSLISDGRDVSIDAGQVARCAFVSLSSTCLLGADTSGANAFISTTDPLTSADTNTELDFYDARICTEADPCIKAPSSPPAPCLGEACHDIPAAQLSAPTGGSLTFNGPGNVAPSSAPRPVTKSLSRAQKLALALKACRKRHRHSKKRRAACEHVVRKRYGPIRRAKGSAHANRRPSR